jgi:hypothetical protein
LSHAINLLFVFVIFVEPQVLFWDIMTWWSGFLALSKPEFFCCLYFVLFLWCWGSIPGPPTC